MIRLEALIAILINAKYSHRFCEDHFDSEMGTLKELLMAPVCQALD